MDTAAAPQEIQEIARRMIWWKQPQDALRYPERLLAQVMAIGTWDDVQKAKRLWIREEFVAVLKQPPPGVFDRRSWVYWHRVLNIDPVPPLPQALIGDGCSLALGLSCARAIYRDAFNAMLPLKALTFFEDGDLPALPIEVKHRLALAVEAVREIPSVSAIFERISTAET